MPFNANDKIVFDKMYEKLCSMSDKDAKMVGLMYKMIDMLDKADETYEIEVPPQFMGIHTYNSISTKNKQRCLPQLVLMSMQTGSATMDLVP